MKYEKIFKEEGTLLMLNQAFIDITKEESPEKRHEIHKEVWDIVESYVLLKKGIKPVPKKKEPDINDKIIQLFKETYEQNRKTEYIIPYYPEERSHAGKILDMHNKKYRVLLKEKKIEKMPNTEETLLSFKAYFESCMLVKDDFLYKKMSLKIAVSEVNQINIIIRNGNKSGKSNTGASQKDIAGAIATEFASDR